MGESKRLDNLMAQLAVNYRREVTAADAANFKLMLTRWGVDALEAAVHAHMFDPDDGRYFPNIANIAKHIDGTAKQNAAAIEDRAVVAWAVIEGAIRRIGSYGTLRMDDQQALAAVKAMGGWSHLCASNADDLTWRRKEFIQLYHSFERVPLEALPMSLPGRIELSLRPQGLKALGHIELELLQRRAQKGEQAIN